MGALSPLALLLPSLDLQDHFGRKQTGNHSHCIEVQEAYGKTLTNIPYSYSVKGLRQINKQVQILCKYRDILIEQSLYYSNRTLTIL